MKHDLPDGGTLGADLRALRKARGLRLADLATATGRSIGWLSQVERDMSEPSIADLRALADVLDVSLSSLFHNAAAPAVEQGHVVRRAARRPIGSREAGLVEELLSPDLTDAFEVIHSTFEPGARLGDPVTRPTQEVGYVVSGQLEVTIAGRPFSLFPGDSFRIKGEPFTWMNPHAEPCVVIWVIAPPVY
ncbi:MAG: helix-turn-helix domain-containing protein [Rhodobacterales bacterium]|nr:helix-turn-helix domain-containing protein [Rhodobacterales bacterium]